MSAWALGGSPARFLARSRAPARIAAADRLVVRVYTLDLVLVVMTQKIAFPVGGPEAQITAAMLIHFACVGFLALRGGVVIPPWRLIAFTAFTTIVAVSQFGAVSRSFSLPSMMLMLMIGAMLVVAAPVSPAGYRRLLNRFVLVALAAAALVGVDWITQGVGLPMPSLDVLIPKPLVYYAYIYIQPLQWGSPWMKPNGLFFLEASHVSQFIAMGLVVELAVFRRWAVIAALGAALPVTFGVTGLLLLATSLPFLLARARPGTVAGLAMLLAVLGLGAYQVGLLDNFLRRTSEFSQNSSSGYNRFVLPVEWSVAALTGPADQAWLGTGAGSMPKGLNDDEAGVVGYAWPPYTKVGVEYGTLALIAWLTFIGRSLIGPGVPLAVAWVAFGQYNFLNGSLNVPIHTIYCVLLCAGVVVTPALAMTPPLRARPRPAATSRPLKQS